MVGLDYVDTIQLVTTQLSSDGYASEQVLEVTDVPALFIANTGWAHAGNQSVVTSDAQMYIDPTNETVLEKFDRLEGMLVIAHPFGEDEAEAWYRITQVIIGQDKLLDNQIDNISCLLKKSTEIPYVS